jgi:hypothetical protein
VATVVSDEQKITGDAAAAWGLCLRERHLARRIDDGVRRATGRRASAPYPCRQRPDGTRITAGRDGLARTTSDGDGRRERLYCVFWWVTWLRETILPQLSLIAEHSAPLRHLHLPGTPCQHRRHRVLSPELRGRSRVRARLLRAAVATLGKRMTSAERVVPNGLPLNTRTSAFRAVNLSLL